MCSERIGSNIAKRSRDYTFEATISTDNAVGEAGTYWENGTIKYVCPWTPPPKPNVTILTPREAPYFSALC